MQLAIEILTDESGLAFALMGDPASLGPGSRYEIPNSGGATLVIRHLPRAKADGWPQALDLLLNLGTGVVTGVVANWLWAKLRGRVVRLTIDQTEVSLDDEAQICRVLLEKLDSEQ
jgi:hypothetical protein